VCPVEVHAYADRIVIRQDGRIVGEHPRSFGRGDDRPKTHLAIAIGPSCIRSGARGRFYNAVGLVSRLEPKHAMQVKVDLPIT
jgi:hypothetical protein